MNSPFLTLLVFTPLLAPLTAAEQGSEPAAFFESKVRPILVERCLECHSHAKKIKGGLALDTKAGWQTGGDTGPALVPGTPEQSLLIKAVSWQDRELQMPPKKKLSDAELAILTDWVRMGAPDPRIADGAVKPKASTAMSLGAGRKFWSYAPLKPVAVPEVKNSEWPRGSIDRFILAKLEQQNLKPGADAEPAVLARRLAFGLTGMPPEPAQLERLARSSKEVEELVDELLKSSRFGEAWGRHWLDVARFAESSGGGRTLLFKDAWRYRDYVVQAFNADHPFDQMIREQVAGDLLPAASDAERARNLVATGFLALGPTIYEEQDKQRLRFDVIDEQVDTLGKAFLGQTIGCARCHDHKFDPISQRDYYALAGIFASTRTLSSYTANVVKWIDASLPLNAREEKKYATAEKRLAGMEQALKDKKNKLAKLQDKASGIAGKTDQPLPLGELAGVVLDDQDARASGEWKHSTHSKHYFGQGYLHDDGKEKGARSLAFTPKLPASGRYEVRLAYPALAGRSTKVPVHIFHAMGDDTVYVNESREPPIAGRFVSLGVYPFEKDGDSYVIVSNEGTKGYVCADVVQFLPEGASDQLDRKLAGGTELKKLQAEVKQMDAALAGLKAAAEARPVTMSVREEDSIGDTQICIRGDVHQRSSTVPRGFLSVAWEGGKAMPGDQSGRRELAEWLTSPRNPLTARVMVNRVWAWLFGTGLVRTVDNFGTTGEAPSHPELLDYLAQRFVDQGWSVKKLVREIVSSRTWQLAVSPDAKDRDSLWFAHAHRRRLEAEQIRDAMLTVSGALNPQVGGPNINGAKAAAADSGDASAVEFGYQFTDTRRSLYTPAFRNNRLELFETFDFGDINTSQGQRYASTVAPQALFFMNHPFVIEQSRAAAAQALSSSADDAELLARAFVQCLGRAPNAKEREACLRQVARAGTGEPERLEAWSLIYQSLFGCIDFRYLD